MSMLQNLFKTGLLGPVKKLGLELSKFWPLPVPVTLDTGRMMYVDLRSSVGRGIFATGKFDPEVFAPLAEVLRPGDTFVDVGANVGYYSMRALDLIGSAGSIHAFEIDPRPLRCLKKTILKENLHNITLHEIAAGEKATTMGFSMKKDCGHSSLTVDDGKLRVPVGRMDEIIRAQGDSIIRAMKIDIEGAELPALRGASALLEAHHPLLGMEWDEELQEAFGYKPAELYSFLEKMGYSLTPLSGTCSPTIVARFL